MRKIFDAPWSWLQSEQAFYIYEDCLYFKEYKHYQARVASYKNNQDIRCLCCSDGEEKIGIVVYQLSNDHTAEILGIAIHKSYRNRGNGKYLLQKSFESLRLQKVIVETSGTVGKFFEHSGFRLEEIYNSGSNLYIYELD